MPSSPSESIPYIIEFARKHNPNLKSALDIGIGFGKMGYLFREYFDVKKDLVYQPKDWKLQITGVEIFSDYISDVQRIIYNKILIGDVFDILPTVKTFDLAILSDVLEHFAKEQGYNLLDELFKHVEGIIIGTPQGFLNHPSRNENSREAHLSGWVLDDFKKYTVVEKAIVNHIQNSNKTIVVYLKK